MVDKKRWIWLQEMNMASRELPDLSCLFGVSFLFLFPLKNEGLAPRVTSQILGIGRMQNGQMLSRNPGLLCNLLGVSPSVNQLFSFMEGHCLVI
jgi:hypothetical protein